MCDCSVEQSEYDMKASPCPFSETMNDDAVPRLTSRWSYMAV